MDEVQLPDLKDLVGAKTDGTYRDQDGHVQQYLHPITLDNALQGSMDRVPTVPPLPVKDASPDEIIRKNMFDLKEPLNAASQKFAEEQAKAVQVAAEKNREQEADAQKKVRAATDAEAQAAKNLQDFENGEYNDVTGQAAELDNEKAELMREISDTERRIQIRERRLRNIARSLTTRERVWISLKQRAQYFFDRLDGVSTPKPTSDSVLKEKYEQIFGNGNIGDPETDKAQAELILSANRDKREQVTARITELTATLQNLQEQVDKASEEYRTASDAKNALKPVLATSPEMETAAQEEQSLLAKKKELEEAYEQHWKEVRQMLFETLTGGKDGLAEQYKLTEFGIEETGKPFINEFSSIDPYKEAARLRNRLKLFPEDIPAVITPKILDALEHYRGLVDVAKSREAFHTERSAWILQSGDITHERDVAKIRAEIYSAEGILSEEELNKKKADLEELLIMKSSFTIYEVEEVSSIDELPKVRRRLVRSFAQLDQLIRDTKVEIGALKVSGSKAEAKLKEQDVKIYERLRDQTHKDIVDFEKYQAKRKVAAEKEVAQRVKEEIDPDLHLDQAERIMRLDQEWDVWKDLSPDDRLMITENLYEGALQDAEQALENLKKTQDFFTRREEIMHILAKEMKSQREIQEKIQEQLEKAQSDLAVNRKQLREENKKLTSLDLQIHQGIIASADIPAAEKKKARIEKKIQRLKDDVKGSDALRDSLKKKLADLKIAEKDRTRELKERYLPAELVTGKRLFDRFDAEGEEMSDIAVFYELMVNGHNADGVQDELKSATIPYEELRADVDSRLEEMAAEDENAQQKKAEAQKIDEAKKVEAFSESANIAEHAYQPTIDALLQIPFEQLDKPETYANMNAPWFVQTYLRNISGDVKTALRSGNEMQRTRWAKILTGLNEKLPPETHGEIKDVFDTFIAGLTT